MKPIQIMAMFALLFGIICSPGCGGGSSGDRFLGNWQSDAYGLAITKNGDLFILNVTRTSGYEGLQGEYTAKLENGSLKVNPTMFGEATLSTDSQTIYWFGSEWHKK
jgi:hypothetical protein